MIAPLRQRHRVMTIALAIIVIPLFVLALLKREPVGENEVEASLSHGTSLSAYPDVTGSLSFEGWESEVTATIRSGGEGEAVDIVIHSPLKIPSPLLYWSGSSLGELVLIGSFPTVGERTLQLPSGIGFNSGVFAVYSLGHQEMVSRASYSATEVTR